MRGLFEIALHRRWPAMAHKLLVLCKTVDKRLWAFENPLRQFTILNHETLVKLEAKKASIHRLRDMKPSEIGKQRPQRSCDLKFDRNVMLESLLGAIVIL